MECIEQRICKLFENKINYQNIDKEKSRYEKNEKIILNEKEFFDMLQNKNTISIITGSNGIGKTYLLDLLNNNFTKKGIKVLHLKLKKYNNLNEIKEKSLDDYETIILDGLDELNTNITYEAVKYIFSIENKNIIISSRKDFLQKNDMLNAKNNIYEILPIEDSKVKTILKQYSIDESKIENIFNILTIPRFLIYIIEIWPKINNIKELNKYKILEFIVDKHFEELNKRASEKIEKNIHKKLLQSIALVMMMLGKTNLTMEEFVTILNRTNYLDIKNYMLSGNRIDNFLHNQLLEENGKIIQFENKEIIEFLAAKEIIENKFSNNDLYGIVINTENEINSFWFNTISYLVAGSRIYRKLILNYIENNIKKQDNLLNLVLNIEFSFGDAEYIAKISEKVIFQYTKLYQYVGYEDNRIITFISGNYKDVFNKLIKKVNKVNFNRKIDEFDIIYINNIFSIIYDILERYKARVNERNKLKSFLIKNENIMNNFNINVRYLRLYLKIMDITNIDSLISSNEINNRLMTLILGECNRIKELKKLDNIINNYILNCGKKFEENNYYMNEYLIEEFILENYNTVRINNLLKGIKSDSNVANFFRFINRNKIKILEKCDDATSVNILNERVIKKIFTLDSEARREIMDEIICDRRKGEVLEKIIDLAIKYRYIQINKLSEIDTSNYIERHISELIIKKLLERDSSLENIYNKVSDKELIFCVWKNNLQDDKRDKLDKKIEKLFPELHKKHILANYKLQNKEYVKINTVLDENIEKSNIYEVIASIYELVNNENFYVIIDKNTIMKNKFKKIIKKIDDYIYSVNIKDISITYNGKTGNFKMSTDWYYYPKAIYILKKGNIDINKYNNKNIILLNNFNDEIKTKYSDKNIKVLINYLKDGEKEGYIRWYINPIIEKLKYKYANELTEMAINWLELYNFDDYNTNQLLSVLCENIDKINEEKIKKMRKLKRYKVYQDLLILLNKESEISNRINYIKENLVFSGDLFSIEKNGSFEYSSKYYTNPLSQIDVKYIKYIIDIVEFAFNKYNEGDYYYFTKYILDMAIDFIRYNIKFDETNQLIERIISLEKNNKNRYLYNVCKNIATIKEISIKQVEDIIKKVNHIMTNDFKKIYTYDELLKIVKEILEEDVFRDMKRMKFFEIFRDKEGNIQKLKEQTYQFLIGYELSRILIKQGFDTKVIYESTGFDKKRCDIQLISEGFIENIVIETKLLENDDIGNENKIKKYINTKLTAYKNEFSSPKILFVLINQDKTVKTCTAKLKQINDNNMNFVYPILINLKDIFDDKNDLNDKKIEI